MNKGQIYFQFMWRIYDVTKGLIPSLRFDKKHPWHRNMVALYCSILQLHHSAYVLLSQKAGIGIPILFRSMIEAYVDLINLSKDKCYGYHMEAAELQQWIRLNREAISTPNRYLKEFTKNIIGRADLPNMESELQRLKDQGHGPLYSSDRFARANLRDAYFSIYNSLCCESHNNIRALTTRHVLISEDGKDFRIQLCPPFDLQEFILEIDAFCNMLMDATEIIHRKLESGAANKIATLKQELEQVSKTEPPPTNQPAPLTV